MAIYLTFLTNIQQFHGICYTLYGIIVLTYLLWRTLIFLVTRIRVECYVVSFHVYVFCKIRLCVIIYSNPRGWQYTNNKAWDDTRENYVGPEPPYLLVACRRSFGDSMCSSVVLYSPVITWCTISAVSRPVNMWVMSICYANPSM